ncbi:ATP-grasp domain-containing protein [Streptomyces poonensis]|uniref:ATP-grasp domain-containing protein n=1 Tax=Streptomyces poonensis TaxID=68255 RepID=A0A918UMI0_9ACTN|nr:ATP-grasp domain-containing protein [Streptomyces poonensis]GGZ21253.1 hypothetical protein GCM10010365_47040 [Streptomyces poonensis]
MKRPHVLALGRAGYGAFRSADGRPYLDPARYEVTFVVPPGAASLPDRDEVSRVVTAPLLEEQAVADLIPLLKQGPEVHRVVALNERLLLPAARIRTALGLAGLTEEQTLLLRDKTRMKRHFARYGVRVPAFAEIDRPWDAAPLLAEYGKIVLKPVDAAGSIGVHIVDDERSLRRLDEAGLGHEGRYEAEEFVEGDLHHVDSVVRDGRPVTVMASRYLDPNHVFPWGGHCRSVALGEGAEREVLLEANRRVLAALEWFSGVTHLEVFLNRRGEPVFCEVAGRAGGGGVVPAFRHRFGTDLRQTVLMSQLGLALPSASARPPMERRATGWSVIYPPEPGPFQSSEHVPRPEWLLDLKLRRKPGEVLTAARSFADGVAVATVCGPDPFRVAHRLDRVKDSLVGAAP